VLIRLIYLFTVRVFSWHGPPFPVEARQPGPDPDRTS
jgi:hypothetical protein